MLAFVVGVLVGAGASLLIVGFLAVVAEDDERRYLKQKEMEREAKRKEEEYRSYCQ